MLAIGHISDTEAIDTASWSLFEHHGAAAFTLSERSPLPPALSEKDLPGRRTQVLTVCRFRKMNHHPGNSQADSVPESISYIESWSHRDVNLDCPNDSDDDSAAEVKSEMEQENAIENWECPEMPDLNVMPNVPGLIRPTRKSKRQADMVLVTVNAIQMRRNKGVK
jgi:hypothetical protein